MADESAHPVVLFDGACVMCSRSVPSMIRRDPKGNLRFAAVQSAAGRRLLAGVPRDVLPYGKVLEDGTPGTMIVIDGGRVYTQSDSTLRIVRYLRWPWPLMGAFVIVPRGLRNVMYRWVARNRHRWFGRRETCYVAGPGEAGRFLN